MIQIDPPITRPRFTVTLPGNVNTRAGALYFFAEEVRTHYLDGKFDNANYHTTVRCADGETLYLDLHLGTTHFPG